MIILMGEGRNHASPRLVRDPAHGQRFLIAAWAIVHAGQQVAVQIDKGRRERHVGGINVERL
jgi:hypothetical protein